MDKHRSNILRANENKSYNSKKRISNQILIDNKSILSFLIDKGL